MGFLDEKGLSHLWEKVKNYIDARPGGGAPVGTIVIWSGTADNIPAGWQLCDGTNGTPDLRDKFVLGAGDKHPVGDKGGSEEVTLTAAQMPSHTHSFSGEIANATASSNGSHFHPVNLAGSTTDDKMHVVGGSILDRGFYSATYGISGYAGAHTHSVTGTISGTNTSTGSSQPHSNMPPYYSLCYIIKTAPDETDHSPAPTSQDINAPIGAIMAWSKSVDEIPQGWHICDGTEGTVDLRDKFVLGAGGKYNPNATGGSEEVVLTVEQMPAHTHYANYPNGSISFAAGSTTDRTFNARIAGTNILTSQAGSSHPHNNMPPYLALIFIQKISVTPTDYVTEERVDEKIAEAITTSIIDGWTVRRHSDGYAEMFYTQTLTIPSSWWTAWGGIYTVSANKIPNINYPITLVKKLQELVNVAPAIDSAWSMTLGLQFADKTQMIGLIRGTALSIDIPVTISYSVSGLWK